MQSAIYVNANSGLFLDIASWISDYKNVKKLDTAKNNQILSFLRKMPLPKMLTTTKTKCVRDFSLSYASATWRTF